MATGSLTENEGLALSCVKKAGKEKRAKSHSEEANSLLAPLYRLTTNVAQNFSRKQQLANVFCEARKGERKNQEQVLEFTAVQRD